MATAEQLPDGICKPLSTAFASSMQFLSYSHLTGAWGESSVRSPVCPPTSASDDGSYKELLVGWAIIVGRGCVDQGLPAHQFWQQIHLSFVYPVFVTCMLEEVAAAVRVLN